MRKKACDPLRNQSRLKWEHGGLCFLAIPMDREEGDVQESPGYITR